MSADGGTPAAPGRHRAAFGIRAWVQERARGSRQQVLRMAPAAIAASLVAAALAPFAQVEIGVAGAGVAGVLLAQLGQVGANYIAQAMDEVIRHLRAGGASPVTEAEIRDALAGELERWLAEAPGAEGLRGEMADLLRSVDGVKTALEAAFDSDAQALQQQLAQGLAEFGDLSDVVVAALDSLQRGVTEVLRSQRRSAETEDRVLLELGLLRRQIRALAVRSPEAEAEAAPAAGPRPVADTLDETAPYRGLAAFQVRDAEWFHGREALTVTLVNRVAERLPGPSLVMVVGASGAGKSSLLNAGFIPAVRDGVLAVPGSDSWPYLLMSPGASPIRDLAIGVATRAGISAGSVEADLRSDPSRFTAIVRQSLQASANRLTPAGAPVGPGRLILVVDQFEELFTQCRDQDERRDFVRALCTAASATREPEPPPAVVVLGLRADFYTECTGHPELVELLEDSQVVVGPMSRSELRHAIERPAELAGLTLEPGLVDVIVRDLDSRLAVGDHPGYDPGRLPLLSHALLATWERRRGRELTLAGYHAAGGIEQAVTTTADRLYAGLEEPEQAMVRQLLLRLVVVSESAAEDARGRVSREELMRARAPEARRAIETALDALVRARLVTATEDSFEITHEALLRAWPRLQSWIEADREWLALRRHLAEAAASWQRGEGELYGTTRLARLREQVDDGRRGELDHREAAFLAASEEHEASTERRERRVNRALRALAAVLGGLLLVASFLAVFAQTQSRAADQQRRIALSRQLAAQARALRTSDPAVSALLGLEAFRIADTVEARSGVLSTQAPYYTELPAREAGRVNGVALSGDGQMLAAAGQRGVVQLWELRSHAPLATLRDGDDLTPVQSVALSRDGGSAASTRQNGAVELWDVRLGRRAAVLRDGWGAINSAAYSPTGGLLATGGNDGTVKLWDTAAGALIASLPGPDGPTSTVTAVAFSPDGQLVASAAGDGSVVLWDVASHRQVSLGDERHAGPARAVAFSPDGRTLATGGDDGSVRLWDVAGRRPDGVLGTSASVIRTVAFGPDGRTLAAGSDRGAVQLWDVASRGTPSSLAGPTAAVLGLAFAPDGTLAAAEANASIGLWDRAVASIAAGRPGPGSAAPSSIAAGPRSPEILATAGGSRPITLWRTGHPSTEFPDDVPTALAFSRDGRYLAAGASGGDVTLWNITTQSRATALAGDGNAIRALAFSPDGRYLAVGGAGAQIWDVNARITVRRITDHLGTVTGLAFSPDGRTLASGGDDGTIVLSTVPDGTRVRVLTGHLGAVQAVAYSPDGRTIASGSADDRVDLWDSARSAPVTALLGHTAPVVSVAFSSDGATLASASDDRTVVLWRLSDRAPLAVLEDASVSAVVFSPDGHTLAGVDRGGRALLWDTDAGRVVGRICQDHPSLTQAQWQQYLPPDQPYRAVCP